MKLVHDCIPRVFCTVCNDTATVYLFTNFTSLPCGKERPPRVEIIYVGYFTYNGFVCECRVQDENNVQTKLGSDSASKDSLVHFPLSLVLCSLFTLTRE